MAKHTSQARCHLTAFDELECVIPFHANPAGSRRLIAEWKDAIPYRSRPWDPSAKVWRFLGSYRAMAAALLLRHFPDAEVPRQFRADSQPRAARGADHFRILHLRETAPVELIEASYRVLARFNHPDRGGTNEAMQAINGAYAALRERVSV